MTIKEKTNILGNLRPGDIFYYNTDYYMVCERFKNGQYYLSPDDKPGKQFIVSLKGGIIMSLDKETNVEKIDAELWV